MSAKVPADQVQVGDFVKLGNSRHARPVDQILHSTNEDRSYVSIYVDGSVLMCNPQHEIAVYSKP